MGRAKPLTAEEKGRINAFSECGLSNRRIASKIGRSLNVVNNYLRNQSGYGKNMKGGTYKATTEADRRAIIRTASNSHESASKIREKTGVSASLATVKRVIRSAKHLKRLKLKKNHRLIAFAKRHGFSSVKST